MKYIRTWYRALHFSSTGSIMYKVGGVKCQPFLKLSNHLKRALKMFLLKGKCAPWPI